MSDFSASIEKDSLIFTRDWNGRLTLCLAAHCVTPRPLQPFLVIGLTPAMSVFTLYIYLYFLVPRRLCAYAVQPDTESRAPSTQRSSRDVIRRLRLEDGANVSMRGWDAVPMDGAFTVEAWFRLMVGCPYV